MKHLERDDMVIAVGLGLTVGAIGTASMAFAFALLGILYITLALVLGTR